MSYSALSMSRLHCRRGESQRADSKASVSYLSRVPNSGAMCTTLTPFRVLVTLSRGQGKPFPPSLAQETCLRCQEARKLPSFGQVNNRAVSG